LMVAKRRHIPVIVDAAAQIPPSKNLWAFTHMGADLVLFSGGKCLGGPQNTGLIVGRNDLIGACALLGSPNYALGRPMKVGKEEMFGLLAAVEYYLERGEKEQRERCEDWTALLIDELASLSGLQARRRFPNVKVQPLAEALVEFDESRLGLTRDAIVQQLAQGAPRIEVASCGRAGILINPDTLKEGDVKLVADRLKTILTENSA
jgi:seryl-tRNA(Sec) selenium transferase